MIDSLSEKLTSRRAALGKLGLLGLGFLVPTIAAVGEAEAKKRRSKKHKAKKKHHGKHRRHH